jgi:threonine/homoserine/homoserine lactone efflux protein
MLTALASGLLLGLSCGIAPGPLLALLVAQALRHGPSEGCKIALAPIVTDLPIILVALALASRVAELQRALGALSIAGGLFVLYLAWDTLRTALWSSVRADDQVSEAPPRSWLKGVVTNVLSPHPWLFWTTVGATILAKAMASGWQAAALFLGAFYLLLVGSKLLLALAVGRWRAVLRGRAYRLILLVLGTLLVVFAVLLLLDGGRRILDDAPHPNGFSQQA